MKHKRKFKDVHASKDTIDQIKIKHVREASKRKAKWEKDQGKRKGLVALGKRCEAEWK